MCRLCHEENLLGTAQARSGKREQHASRGPRPAAHRGWAGSRRIARGRVHVWLWTAARAPRCGWVAGRGEPSRKVGEKLGQRSTWTDPHQRGRPRGKGARTHQGHQNPKLSKGRQCWGARPGTPVCGTDAKRCSHAHTPRGPCSGAADLPQEQTHLQGSHSVTAIGKAPEETQRVTSEPAHIKTSRL